jgi:hypothetical protein
MLISVTHNYSAHLQIGYYLLSSIKRRSVSRYVMVILQESPYKIRKSTHSTLICSARTTLCKSPLASPINRAPLSSLLPRLSHPHHIAPRPHLLPKATSTWWNGTAAAPALQFQALSRPSLHPQISPPQPVWSAAIVAGRAPLHCLSSPVLPDHPEHHFITAICQFNIFTL